MASTPSPTVSEHTQITDVQLSPPGISSAAVDEVVFSPTSILYDLMNLSAVAQQGRFVCVIFMGK